VDVTRHPAVHAKEHHQVARTPAAEALAPMEAPTGTVSSKAELKAHLQEVKAAHKKESRYTAKVSGHEGHHGCQAPGFCVTLLQTCRPFASEASGLYYCPPW
jgi:hypothetical protein